MASSGKVELHREAYTVAVASKHLLWIHEEQRPSSGSISCVTWDSPLPPAVVFPQECSYLQMTQTTSIESWAIGSHLTVYLPCEGHHCGSLW